VSSHRTPKRYAQIIFIPISHPSSFILHPFSLILSLLLLSPSALFGGLYYWDDGGGDGLWANDANWTTTAPDGSDYVYFDGGNATPAASNNDITGLSLDGIFFKNSLGAHTISGNSITLTNKIYQQDAATQTINLDMNLSSGTREFQADGGDLVLGGVLSGTAGLNLTHGNDVTLSGDNTYSGGVTVGSGTLVVKHEDGLGESTADTADTATTVSSGATLALNNATTMTIYENLNINGTGLSSAGAIDSVDGSHTIKGTETMAGNSTIDVSASDDALTLDGVVSGSAALTKTGAGDLVMTQNNVYTGATIVNDGILSIQNKDALGDTTGITTVNSGQLFLNFSTATIDEEITLNGGELAFDGSGNIATLSESLTITAAGSRIYGTTQGVLKLAGGISGSLDLEIEVGNSTIVLYDNSSYTGDMTIIGDAQGGRANLYYNDNALGSSTSTTTLVNGAFLGFLPGVNTPSGQSLIMGQIGDASETYLRLYGDGVTASSFGGNITVVNDAYAYNGAVTEIFTLGGSGKTMDIQNSKDFTLGDKVGSIDGADIIVASEITDTAGSGNIVKTDGFTAIFSGDNTYSGTTTINDGTLQIGNGGTTGSIAAGSAITNNGSLAFNRTDTMT
jgi:fibronectin-binding autotransporter adhesin